MTDRELIRPGSTRLRWALAGALLLAVPVLASGQSGEAYPAGDAPLEAAEVTAPISDERASYSYLRTLEGSATAAAAGQGIGEPLEVNQPLLTGDLVRVDVGLAPRSWRSPIAIASSSTPTPASFSSASPSRATGRSASRSSGSRAASCSSRSPTRRSATSSRASSPRTPRSTFRSPASTGSKPASAATARAGRGWSPGAGSPRSSPIAARRWCAADEAIVALGDREANLEIGAADALDALERWSGVLSERAERASRSASYVEPHLAYDAAPLDESGDWIEVENVSYWRPVRFRRLAPLLAGTVGLDALRLHLGLLRALGLGALSLRPLVQPPGLRLGLAARRALLAGLGLLELDQRLCRLGPDGLLQPLLQPLVQRRIPLRRLRLGRRRLGSSTRTGTSRRCTASATAAFAATCAAAATWSANPAITSRPAAC